MTPTSNPAQDTATAVAVLQNQQQSLDTAVREMARTIAEGFAGINVKMDRVNELASTVAQLSVRQESHSDSLTRAFATMENFAVDAKAHAAEEQAYRDEVNDILDKRFAIRDAHHDTLNQKMSVARGWVAGAGALLAGSMGMMFWMANQFIDQIQTTDREVDKLQIEAARNGEILKQLTPKE